MTGDENADTQILVAQERYRDAEAVARKACKEFERRSQDHPAFLGECYLYLGVILVRQERQQDALPYLETSLNSFEGFFGKDTPDIAPVLASLAGIYMDMGRPSAAGHLLNHSTQAQGGELDGFHGAPRTSADTLTLDSRLY